MVLQHKSTKVILRRISLVSPYAKNYLVLKKKKETIKKKKMARFLLEAVHLDGIPECRVGTAESKGKGNVWQRWGSCGSSGVLWRGLHTELGMDANVALNVDLSF